MGSRRGAADAPVACDRRLDLWAGEEDLSAAEAGVGHAAVAIGRHSSGVLHGLMV
jgi:hypothetical protein